MIAVDDIDFAVAPGEVFGFLGPNGAGKTTTINMLCTMLRPTSGTAVINGHGLRRHPDRIRQSIGIIFQDPCLDDRFTALENLRFHAMLYDVPRSDFGPRADELLALLDLADKAHAPTRMYSGGMKRRLEIARGLLHRPPVLFLDEPTIGLDPQTRRHIWQYLLELRRQQGITMFMTTHYMEEAEHCDRIAVIDRGRLAALDTPQGLKALAGGDVVAVVTSDNDRAVSCLTRVRGSKARLAPGGEVIIETTDANRSSHR
ncbi:MAG: ATP-binding cassette domain-containing protein [Vicinamibacterales bacterium]